MTTVLSVTQSQSGRTRRRPVTPEVAQLALPLELNGQLDGGPGTVEASAVNGGSSVHQSGARQKAGELRRMKDPNSLASSLERLAELAETADATGEDSQEFIDARNNLIVQAAKAGASRGQIARLAGVSDGTVIDILERVKNNGRPRRG
nr:hypothetical protein [Rhodococcus sp. (in: high G+C Gram-positive bacteria)]